MNGLDTKCDAITHGRCLLLGSEVNQSRVCEVPIGGTSVGLAVLRMAWPPHGHGLRPKDIVVMDNLSAHKIAGVQEAIEVVDAEVRYLPLPDPNALCKESLSIRNHKTFECNDLRVSCS